MLSSTKTGLFNTSTSAKSDKLRITIFGGGGAVGAYFSYQFLKAGHDVAIVFKENSQNLAHVLTTGLTLSTSDSTVNLPCNAFSYIGDMKHIPNTPVQDVVIICVKQYDMSAELLEAVVRITNENSVIGIITNGLPFYFTQGLAKEIPSLNSIDPAGTFSQILSNRIVMGIWPIIAAERNQNIIIKRPLDAISVTIGTPEANKHQKTLYRMLATFNAAKIKTQYVESGLHKIALEKLQFSLAINTLSAVMEKTLGDIFYGEKTQAFIAYTIELIGRIATSLSITNLRNYEQFKAIAITRGHYSSMYHDIKTGKPAEISAIVDSALELAEYVQNSNFLSIDLAPLKILNNLLRKKISKQTVNESELAKLLEHSGLAINNQIRAKL